MGCEGVKVGRQFTFWRWNFLAAGHAKFVSAGRFFDCCVQLRCYSVECRCLSSLVIF